MNSNIKKILKKIIPASVLSSLKGGSFSIPLLEVGEALESEPDESYRAIAQRVSRKVRVHDEMYAGGRYYLQVGLSALKCIDAAIEESAIGAVKTILDLPCGFGRVMRFVKERFPGAEITACDINTDGVFFCKREFGARAVISRTSLEKFDTGRKFDLIWCGSLATHLDSNATLELFRFFYGQLNRGGLLVLSMHGKATKDFLTSRENTYSLKDSQIEKILNDTETTGYGYADYIDVPGYGISLAKPEWMMTALNSIGTWSNHRFVERGWIDHHDIYSVVKDAD